MYHLTLLPLDERPVSRTLPAQIAAIANATLDSPPPELLPHLRAAPPITEVTAWLGASRARTAASVVSLDAASFGSLIASRIGEQDMVDILAAWAPLTCPGSPVYAAAVIPRTPNSTDTTEEPTYWDPYGPGLHRLCGELATTNHDLTTARTTVAPHIPHDVAADWIGRRARQHTMAMAALDYARRGTWRTLILGLDDSTTPSLSAHAHHDLAQWVTRLALDDVVAIHPGADETGAVLTSRALVDLTGAHRPTVHLTCAEPSALTRTAPYETGPVLLTARRQLHAAGAHESDAASAETILVVHPPQRHPADWALAPPQSTDVLAAQATAALVARHLAQGRAVAVADVAQPNGADPALIAALAHEGAWPLLQGYAAWNTAGNTLGTVAAQVVTATLAARAGVGNAVAHRTMIVRRVVEDYAWMSRVRADVRQELGSPLGGRELAGATGDQYRRWEEHLTCTIRAVAGFEKVSVTPGSLTFPWERTFEIDCATQEDQ